MCGITGFIDFKYTSSESILNNMLNALKRRGPDDNGHFLESTPLAQIGLAQNRLSIIDLSSAAHQPYSFEHLHLIYNGEIYNYKKIQQELIKEGYSFTSHSDTEVLIKAFHCYGNKAVDLFRGMFAFCLYDTHQQKIYLFRDRVGVKPLYFYQKNDLFLFGSTLAPLIQHPQFQKNLDQEGFQHYIQYGYIRAPYSIFQNTHKLLPGHYLVLDLKTHKTTTHCYWNIEKYATQPPLSLTEVEATDGLEQLLQESLQLRMVADVPVGCFLSGGIDSSLVAAILQNQQSTPLHTFTIGFHEKEHNEATYAKAIADHLGTKHTEYFCTINDVKEILPTLPYMYDEPFADSSSIPTSLVAKIAKQHVKVALSGDGGDELFGGYTVYQSMPSLLKTIKNLPARSVFEKLLNGLPDPMYFFDQLSPTLYKKYAKLKALIPFYEDNMLYQILLSEFTPSEVKHLLNYFIFPHKKNINLKSTMETMMLVDFQYYLPDDILVKVDRASMYHSLEAREPLLDHTLIEYAARLPIHYKNQKKILKTILSRYIPPKLFERPKQGFGSPLQQWLKEELQSFIHEYLSDDKIRHDGLFNTTYVKHLKHQFFSKKMLDRKLWIILMFQMWKEKFY